MKWASNWITQQKSIELHSFYHRHHFTNGRVKQSEKNDSMDMDMNITQTWSQCLCIFFVSLPLFKKMIWAYRTFGKRLFTEFKKQSDFEFGLEWVYLMHSTFTFETMQNANANASKLTSYTFIRANWMETVLTLWSNQIPSSHHSAFVGFASNSMVYSFSFTLSRYAPSFVTTRWKHYDFFFVSHFIQ